MVPVANSFERHKKPEERPHLEGSCQIRVGINQN
jgi:hypothetical protein